MNRNAARIAPSNRRRLAEGCALKPGRRSLVTHFDEDLFGEVRAFAAEQGVSVGEAVRTLCEWGLMSAADEALADSLRRRRLKAFEAKTAP